MLEVYQIVTACACYTCGARPEKKEARVGGKIPGPGLLGDIQHIFIAFEWTSKPLSLLSSLFLELLSNFSTLVSIALSHRYSSTVSLHNPQKYSALWVMPTYLLPESSAQKPSSQTALNLNQRLTAIQWKTESTCLLISRNLSSDCLIQASIACWSLQSLKVWQWNEPLPC